MRYPHLLVILTPAAVDPAEPSTPEEGWNPPAPEEEPVIVYTGRADVQDVGESVVYDTSKTEQESEAVAFLENERLIKDIRSGMTATIVWNPDADGSETDDAVVEAVTRLDGTLKLRLV